MRTTLNIDEPVLDALKRLQSKVHRPLGRIVSDLLQEALKQEPYEQAKKPSVPWVCREMEASVDLADRDAVYDAMDGETEK